jgi:hypothetical protein
MAAMSEPRRLSWGRSALVVALTFIVGVVLAQWKPIWVAPPNHLATAWLYQLVLWLWLPVLVICVLRRPLGPWVWGLVSAVGLALLTVAISATIWGAFIFTPAAKECTQAAASPSLVIYTCSTSFMDSRITLTFEGPPGSPLVRWTGNEFRSF